MEELKNQLKEELRTLSPDELDVLSYRYIKWLKLAKYRDGTVEQRITEVLELV